jgi:hypothetical protein
MRGVGLTVQENEPHMSTYCTTTQTESQDQDEFEVTPGLRAEQTFFSKTKTILVDVTSASGLSRYVKLHRYFQGSS